MPSEWLATAVTGAVGVVGILGTFAASWHQQRVQARIANDARTHQMRDATRTERKAAYVRYLDVAGEVIDKYQDLLVIPANHPSRPAALAASRQVAATLQSAEVEVDIFGNPEIAKEMTDFRMSVLKLLLTAMRPDCSEGSASFPEVSELIENLVRSRLNLLDAVRRDLAVDLPGIKGRAGAGETSRRLGRKALSD